MINHETELKLQAFLDGELPAGDAKSLAELLARDSEARSLIDELRMTRALLIGNELESKLPETLEFYWSKIRREIEFEAQRTRPADPAEAGPASVSLRNREGSSPRWAQDERHEIDTPLEETSSFSFRSEAAAMTVVWVDSHRE